MIPFYTVIRRRPKVSGANHDVEQPARSFRRRVITGNHKFCFSRHPPDRIIHDSGMILHSLLRRSSYFLRKLSPILLFPSIASTMSATNLYLRGEHPRARWKRLDTAQILKRFFFCERSLIIGASAWIPHLSDLELKLAVPFICWQNSETANAL